MRVKELKLNLTNRLFLSYLLLCFATISFVSVFSYYKSKNALISRTYNQLRSVHFEKENTLKRFFNERTAEFNSLATKICLDYLPFSRCSNSNLSSHPENTQTESVLINYLEHSKYFIFTYLTDKQGQITASTAGMPVPSFIFNHDSIYNTFLLKLTHSKEVLFSDYLYDTISKRHLMLIGKYLTDSLSDNHCLLSVVNTDEINSIMYHDNPLNGLGKSGESYLVGRDLKMRTNSRFQSNAVMHVSVNTFGVKNALKNTSGTSQYPDYRGIMVLGSFGRINLPGLEWIILAEIDVKEAMIPIYTIRNSIILLSLIVSLFIFGIAYLISKSISKPLIRLKEASTQISAGYYNINLKSSSNDEVGELSDAFNEMAMKLQQQSEEIKREKANRIRSMIDGQESERQRLSRELHDGLGQNMLATKLRLERFKGKNNEDDSKIIEEVKRLLTDTIQEVRTISNDLMPAVLEEFGLQKAIENLCKGLVVDTNINTELNFRFDHDKLSNKAEIYLFRIIQEAVNNIVRHSGADLLQIEITGHEDNIEVKISDNGIGFNSADVQKGKGLTNIADRVDLLNGKLKIESESVKGTLIHVIIPNK